MMKWIMAAVAMLITTVLGCAPSVEVNCSSDKECETTQQCVAGKCRFIGSSSPPDSTIPVTDANDVQDATEVTDSTTFPKDGDVVSDSTVSHDANIDGSVSLDSMVNPTDSDLTDAAIVADVLPRQDATPVSDALIPLEDTAPTNDAIMADSALPPSPDAGSICDPVVHEGNNISNNGCEVGIGACQGFGHIVCEDNIFHCDAVEGIPSVEQCNGIDDDCDGEIDEDFAELGNPCGEGIGDCISSGVFVCDQADNTLVICSAETLPPSGESCDGTDNNCDGTIDEGYDIGAVCSVGVGACERSGVSECSADGQGTLCNVSSGPPGEEECNNLDDDCNGLVDNGLHLGEDCTVGLGACEVHGRIICSENGSTQCDAVARNPSEEICDGIDNDCDGSVDEAANGSPILSKACYSGPDGSLGIGVCRNGTQLCINGIFGACTGEVTPTDEICNGNDDDCNGDIDNNIPGVGSACVTRLPGICSTGRTLCNAENALVCQPDNLVGAVTEVCGNGRDEDCNGVTDDGALCACAPFAIQNCYDGPLPTNGVGLCHSGTQTCNADGTSLSPCQGAVTPVPEICDDLDNDCNGSTDESIGKGDQCHVGIGACARDGIMVCAPGGGTMCNIVPGNSTPELCNGIDDDCDGSIDEAVAGGPLTQPCYTGRPLRTEGIGTCHGGTQTCANGNFGLCNGEVTPAVEFCDGRDEDCNGVVDNGYDVGTLCSVGLGPCHANGVTVCTPNGESTQCNAVAGVPVPEVCDEIDNDCDGDIDNGVKNACGLCGPVPVEVCNHIDDDCDGVIDDGFVDGDGDGWAACAGDCRDADPRINPGHAEVCDELDNNCEGHINEGLNPTCICKDQEQDRSPTCETVYATVQAAPQGWAFIIPNEGITSQDCDDGNPQVNPNHAEVCLPQGRDDNCNGLIDEGLVCN
jgi:hypothetical protein